ncbi:MAG: NADH-quinone oxidoreductase subunit N [Chloroflexi bacterium]|nr:NADH-quinone oxidoreductase subunit N [Chloroflexota bacterium]
MTLHDVYLLSPELSLAALGMVVILLDLVVRRKGVLAAVSVAGLALPLALSIALWGDLGGEADGQMAGIFNTLVMDRFSLFFKFLVMGVLALVVMSSVEYVSRIRQFQGEYYGLMLFSACGMMLLAASTDLISIYIALELTSLPLAALAALLRDARSTEAGVKFLLLSAMSSAVLLYGMALTYGFTGTTHLAAILERLGASLDATVPFGSHALFLGVIMIVAGFGFKIASVPFQMWVPDVYEGAPTPITAYLSVASKAAGFAVILRVFYLAFGELSLDWGALFAVLSAVSMTVGNLVAIAQSNIKRMLAYSTIAHAGYLMVGVAAIASRAPAGETILGPSGVLFYLVAYAVTNLAAFFAIIAISNRTGSDTISGFAGMGRRAPFLAIVLAFSMVSLLGIPPTAGFMGKLYMFTAAMKSDLAWLVVVGVVNSAVSAYYYLRVVRVMYVTPPEREEAIPVGYVPLAALVITGLGVLVLGIFPGPLMTFAEKAVAVLFL